MDIYIIIATILFVFAFIPQTKDKTGIVMFVVMAILILFDGLRWENGTDWLQYQTYFEKCLLYDNERYELGYILLNRSIRLLTSEYTVFLLLHATILYSVLYYYFKKYSVYPLLSFFLFFVLFIGYQGMNRQYLALSIGYIALVQLIQNRKIWFLALVCLASFFHMSVYILLLALLSRRFFPVYIYISTIVIAILLSFGGVVNFVADFGMHYFYGSMADYFSSYVEMENEQISATGFSLIFAYIRRLIIIIPFLFIKENIELKVKKALIIFFNLYFVAFIFYIIFSGTILNIIVSRANVYFFIFECILIPYIIYRYRKRFPRAFVYFIIYMYGLFSLYRGISRYDRMFKNPFLPYKAIYYNTDVYKYTD